MKKSVIFLINGLGIERPGSYSISIDEVMPNLSRAKETSYFTTAIISSLEYKEAYESFFLGDTSTQELEYLKEYLINDSISELAIYKEIKEKIAENPNSKIHIFIETLNQRIVEQINVLFNGLIGENKNKKIYLHLLLTQQTEKDYPSINKIINYIRFHLNENIQVGFIIGKESIGEHPTKEENDFLKKMFFECQCERWTSTDVKLNSLSEKKIRPCEVQGFCTTKDCFISNKDMLFFFNTRRENYDNFIEVIYRSAQERFKEGVSLPISSLIRLYSNYKIPSFIENLEYEDSLSNILIRNKKKCLIITDRKNINVVNFYANGLNSINNPIICFMEKTDALYNQDQVEKLINEMPYDLIIFDYEMDTSSTINHLKEELAKLDIILGNITRVCENKHAVFITSLYGLKKTLPVADYNPEEVTINYELRIPIFFYDYSYPKGKYDLFPGETHDILLSALKCITYDQKLTSLIREKTLIGDILKSLMK